MAFGAGYCVRQVLAFEMCTQVPVRSDNELNWAIKPLDIRGGGIVWVMMIVEDWGWDLISIESRDGSGNGVYYGKLHTEVVC